MLGIDLAGNWWSQLHLELCPTEVLVRPYPRSTCRPHYPSSDQILPPSALHLSKRMNNALLWLEIHWDIKLDGDLKYLLTTCYGVKYCRIFEIHLHHSPSKLKAIHSVSAVEVKTFRQHQQQKLTVQTVVSKLSSSLQLWRSSKQETLFLKNGTVRHHYNEVMHLYASFIGTNSHILLFLVTYGLKKHKTVQIAFTNP